MKSTLKLFFLITVVLLIFIPEYSIFPEDISNNTPIGNVISVKGNCFIKHQTRKEFSTIRLDEIIYDNDTIRTDKDSSVEIELNDNSSLNIQEDSEITISDIKLEKKHYTGIGILVGTVKIFVSKIIEGSREFNINTVTFTAGVRGTKFTVSTREDGNTLIQIDKGNVNIKYSGKEKNLTSGENYIFTLDGKELKIRRVVNYYRWRKKALNIIKKNPKVVLKRLLKIEKTIIKRLKSLRDDLQTYHQNWYNFLKTINRLEDQGKYREEKLLIKREIRKARLGMLYIIAARRELTRIRAVMVLTYRIENKLGEKENTIQEIKREYKKINYVIKKLYDTEKIFKRVLYYLNIRYRQLPKS